MEQQVDLLGEPRLKNGLAYYAGVQTSHGTVIVGNVVRLQLQAEGAVPYVGFGYLKGLWLWRDQPYVRVQHMAPSRTDLPKDAIVYTGEETSETELMVTNRVGDLHLNAMLGPVNISDGPLLSQLFQENVGADAESFSCARHLDPAVQRVQPLDEAFRLTPIVQAFPKALLRGLIGVPSPDGMAPSDAEAFMAEALSEPPTTAAPIAEPPAEEAAAPTGIFGRKADPAKPPPPAHRPPPPAPAPAHVSSSNGGGFSAAAAARATPKKQQPPEEKASLLPSSEPRSDANGNAAAGRRTSPSPPRTRQYTDSDLLGIELVGRENGTPLPITSPGFGPASMKTAILLQVTYRGALLRPSLTVRCPSKRSDLYEKLASVFSLVPGSIKVVYQSMPKIWCELGTINELFEALERQPHLRALPVQVSGEELLHLPVLHFLSTLISVTNLIALCLFAYFIIYLKSYSVPYIALLFLPAILILYNGNAALNAITDEYVMSLPLRVALARKDGWLVLLMLISLLGPDPTLLYCRTVLPSLGANLSKTIERDLVFWAAGLHLLQDMPTLAINLLLHFRKDEPWEPFSLILLGTTAASLTINLIWHLFRMMTVRSEEDELPELGARRRGTSEDSPGYRSPSRRSMRKIEGAKYTEIGGGGNGAYEA